MTAVRLTTIYRPVLACQTLLRPSSLYHLRNHYNRRTLLASPKVPPRTLFIRSNGLEMSHRRRGTDSKK